MPSEMTIIKRILSEYKLHTAGFTGTDMNRMIQDSCMDARDKLDPDDRRELDIVVSKLDKKLKQRKAKEIGEKGLLELVSAVAEYVE